MQNKKLRILAFLAVLVGGAALQAQSTNPTYRFVTNLGNINVILTPNTTPITVANFLSYVNSGAYNNVIFHRSVPGFVIQAGGYQYVPGAAYPNNVLAITQLSPIMSEYGATNATGTIAMALTSSSSGATNINSGTSEWFFNLSNNNGGNANNTNLDSEMFTVFGSIASNDAASLKVMNAIGSAQVIDESSLYGADFTTCPLGQGGSFLIVSSIVPVPSITAAGFESAASYAQTQNNGIAPGELLVIYGQQLGPTTLATGTITNNVLNNSLAGTQVLFNGKAAPLYYTSAGQISVVAPYSIAGLPTVDVVVSYNGVQSNTAVFQVKAANPAIFTQNVSGTGDGVIFHPDFVTPVNAAKPASVGEALIMYAEGYGAPTAATTVADGSIIGSVVPVVAGAYSLLIDGQTVPTLYFGGAPGLVNGILQVNFQVPAGLAPGTHQIQLSVAGRTSPTGVTLRTQ